MILKKEWLIRFGFNEVEDTFGYESRLFENLIGYQVVLEFDQFNFQYPSRFVGEIEIKYVHQLQNLYFALTGNELTLIAK